VAFLKSNQPARHSLGEGGPARRQRYIRQRAGRTPALQTVGGPSALRRAGFKPRRKQMVLSPTTACACPPDLWRADPPAQSPPCGVAARAILRSARSLLGGRSLSSDISMPLCPSTACAGSLAQLLTYGLAVRALFGGSLATSLSSLATAFPWPPAVWRLIYGTGIRNRAKSLKT
jgi:hypothetical protein